MVIKITLCGIGWPAGNNLEQTEAVQDCCQRVAYSSSSAT